MTTKKDNLYISLLSKERRVFKLLEKAAWPTSDIFPPDEGPYPEPSVIDDHGYRPYPGDFHVCAPDDPYRMDNHYVQVTLEDTITKATTSMSLYTFERWFKKVDSKLGDVLFRTESE